MSPRPEQRTTSIPWSEAVPRSRDPPPLSLAGRCSEDSDGDKGFAFHPHLLPERDTRRACECRQERMAELSEMIASRDSCQEWALRLRRFDTDPNHSWFLEGLRTRAIGFHPSAARRQETKG